MERFTCLDAVALPVARPNVDTDQIVPARYLQKPRSDDFGAYLFRDLRFLPDGSENPDVLLNQAAYRTSRIVVAERNFGCGSSREHAVWALYDYGFRVAIAPSFGDIFASNALKNGFLPVMLAKDVVDGLLEQIARVPGMHLVVDLESQQVRTPAGAVHRFDVDPYAKHCLLEGIDEISYTLSLLPEIEAYEARLKTAPTAKESQ
jgi:3-isopropylmalate/(R)-2-methylmalate dehydratase small subunit